MDVTSPVAELPFVGPAYQKRLEKLEIKTIRDLLYHVPHRYIDFSNISPIASIRVGDVVTVRGEITFLKNQYTKSGKKIQIGQIKDLTGTIPVIWFNQPFLVRTIFPGDKLSLAGKVDWFGRSKALISPEYEKADAQLHTGRLIPIYPETAGLSSKWLRGRIKNAYDHTLPELKDPLPPAIRHEVGIVELHQAISFIHFPANLDEAQTGRKRLAFDELLNFQIASQLKRRAWQKNNASQKIKINRDEIDKFIASLPFTLTGAQQKATAEILDDIEKETPMNRLLEGDVGSGKTVVAAIACFSAFLNGSQSVIMAPTQILAQQHFQTLEQMFNNYKLRLALITSAAKQADLGKADIIVGTHALLYNKIDFADVALVVIDEQHKFGVEQRAKLVKKAKGRRITPNILTMTATPIPRSVALTLYGDLDLSVLDEMPKGRLPITTWIVPPEKRDGAYTWMKEKIKKEKLQVYVICPLIEESDKELMADVKAVTSEYNKLQKIFSGLKIGLLHGRLKEKEKQAVVRAFKDGQTDILVSTPVVEVGIDVANANIMLIEAAERFGLAQLHQLRGRIGRGAKKAYCLLFAETLSGHIATRLNAVKQENSGFVLAETDLRLRGPGEIFGFRQHGFPELKIASWQDTDLIRQAKAVAEQIIARKKPLRLGT